MRFLPLLLILVLVACGRDAADAPAQPADDPAQPVAATDGAAFELRPAASADVLEHVRAHPAQVKVVNFWATWCVPCRVEFPELVRFADDYRARGADVIFVSADFPDQEPEVLSFLRDHGVRGVSFLKDEGDDAFISAFDDQWMGELPATMMYGPNDERVAVWLGMTTYEALSHKADSLLNLL